MGKNCPEVTLGACRLPRFYKRWVSFLEIKMKNIVLAAAFVGLSTTAFAGNMSEPLIEMEPVVIMEEAGSSSSGSGIIVALILVALIAAAS
jgi:hypothetical protein